MTYVFIITRDGQRFHIGSCTDIAQTVAKYKALISLFYPAKINQLVYLEEVAKEQAKSRVNEITGMTRAEKIKLIDESNAASNQLANDLNL